MFKLVDILWLGTTSETITAKYHGQWLNVDGKKQLYTITNVARVFDV